MKIIVTTAVILLATGGKWGHATSPYSDPHFMGNRSTITHLMEWRYEDIALECERFLGPYGYGGVQLSPVNENAVLDRRPWYERYQPVGYKIETRSGNEQQFTDMVHRCNKAGVRIYVDIVLNHMSGGQKGQGTAGHSYDGNSMQYPGVPFGPNDFHPHGAVGDHNACPTDDLEIHDYSNSQQARNCRLGGLRDLKQSSDYVRTKQVEFLNRLIDIGVAGFRSDASKHMWPEDLQAIYSKLHNLNTKYFAANSRPFIYHEVIYYGGNDISPKEYTSTVGRVIEFLYNRELTNVFRGHNQLKWLKNFGEKWNLQPSNDALVMIDSHDLQRGHTGQLGFNINYFESRLLKAATSFMLAWPYGVPRVMSSYKWNQLIRNGKDENDWIGPPTDSQGHILKVTPKADLSCNSEWICEHRWREIYQMVQFRNIAGNEPVQNWWDDGNYQIAFSRGNKAFVAINIENGKQLQNQIRTGLPAGRYCDIISGTIKDNKCTGKTIEVNASGMAQIVIGSSDFDAVLATHIQARLH